MNFQQATFSSLFLSILYGKIPMLKHILMIRGCGFMEYIIDKEKIDTYLVSKPLSNMCPLCSSPKLELGIDSLYELYAHPLDIGNRIASLLLQIVCKQCGYTAFINGVAQGLVKPLVGGVQDGK